MIGLFKSILLAPINFGRWVLDNGIKGWIVAGIVFFAILIGVIVVQNSIRDSMYANPSYTDQLLTPGPERADAPYKIITDTRVYYAYIALQDEEDGTVTMTNYYELSYGEWQYTEGILVLDENYGTIQVLKRGLHE